MRSTDAVIARPLKPLRPRFPFDHLTLAEIAERDQLAARALRIGLTTSERLRLDKLRTRSYRP